MYLTRKEILARGAFWDITKVQGFAHDKILKSPSGRGRPSYLYLQSRVEAFERGDVIPSELKSIAPETFASPIGAIVGLPIDLVDAIAREKAPSTHASVFNEGPRTVSVVRPIVAPTQANAAPKHSPLVFPPTPKGEKPRIKLVVVDAEGKETLVETPIVFD